jgi:aspartyl/asparaginyl beta-hydroxylase (cupin superfamily)/Flp pilus assembly protein TadD
MGSAIDDLIGTAQSAARAGRLDAAAQAWERVLKAAPNHPQALVFLGQQSLRRGDARGAIEMLQRAVKAAPRDAIVALNLAFAHRAAGDAAGEMSALGAALAADPLCYPALLARGALLERTGQRREAARSYRDALKLVPPDDRISPDLRALAERARAAVKENIEALDAFLEVKLGLMRAGGAQPRFDEAKDAMIGKKQIYVSEASLFRVPRLPAIPFFDRELFPWLPAFEAQTPVIREELINLLQTKKEGFHPYMQYPEGVPLNQWVELNNSMRWRSLDLWRDGERVEEHAKLCPRTMAALEQVPMSFIPGVAPCALFSALEPHTHIPAHAGVTNARSLVHLPLILPGPARFRVGNEIREWKVGEGWVFDDTIEHEAWNDADQLRVIMIIDIWNPLLGEGERELIAAAISGYYEFYRGT